MRYRLGESHALRQLPVADSGGGGRPPTSGGLICCGRTLGWFCDRVREWKTGRRVWRHRRRLLEVVVVVVAEMEEAYLIGLSKPCRFNLLQQYCNPSKTVKIINSRFLRGLLWMCFPFLSCLEVGPHFINPHQSLRVALDLQQADKEGS